MAKQTKGSYVLLIKLPAEQTITAGALKPIRFLPGSYAYVGSAMGGFKARLNRHLKANKTRRWHVDYLLERAYLSGIILAVTEDRIECGIARALSRQFDYVPGFGCSDCKCRSHLFFGTDEIQLRAKVMAIISSHGLTPKLIADSSAIM